MTKRRGKGKVRKNLAFPFYNGISVGAVKQKLVMQMQEKSFY